MESLRTRSSAHDSEHAVINSNLQGVLIFRNHNWGSMPSLQSWQGQLSAVVLEENFSSLDWRLLERPGDAHAGQKDSG